MRVLLDRVEVAHFDRQLAPKKSKHHLAARSRSSGSGAGEDRVTVGPNVVRGAEIREEVVPDAEQTRLFEVWGGDPPTAPQIAVDAVTDHVLQGLLWFRA